VLPACHVAYLPVRPNPVCQSLPRAQRNKTCHGHPTWFRARRAQQAGLGAQADSVHPRGHPLVFHSILFFLAPFPSFHHQEYTQHPKHQRYLFTDIFHEGNEQGGVFNRSFIGLRVENIPVENVRRLADHYHQLDRDHQAGRWAFRHRRCRCSPPPPPPPSSLSSSP
jgi:hypothetical protein